MMVPKPAALGVLGPVMVGPANAPLDVSKLTNVYDFPLLIREAHFTIYGPAKANVAYNQQVAPSNILGAAVSVHIACGRHKLTHSPSVYPIDAVPLRLLNSEIPNLGAEVLSSLYDVLTNDIAQTGMPVAYEFVRWAFDPPFVLDPGEGFHVDPIIPASFTAPGSPSAFTDNLQLEAAFVGEALPPGRYPKFVPYVCAFVGTKGSAYQESNILELSNRLPAPVTVTEIVGFLTDRTASNIAAADFTDNPHSNPINDQSLVLSTLLDPTGFQIAKNVPFTMLFDVNRRALKTRTVMPPSSRFSLSVLNTNTNAGNQTPYAAIHGYQRVD